MEKNIEQRKETKSEIELWRDKYKKHLSRVSYHCKEVFPWFKNKQRNEQLDFIHTYFVLIKNLPSNLENIVNEKDKDLASNKLDDLSKNLLVDYMLALLSLEKISKGLLW